MNKTLLSLALVVLGSASAMAQDATPEYLRVFQPFSSAVFYDGYNGNVFDADKGDGILRHSNSLYAKRLSEQNLDWFGLQTEMDVTIGALCDDYDRIGNISLAFVPKGSETYNPDQVQRIELARFITPFMNKNKWPAAAPYHFDASRMSLIFKDLDLRDKYDFWLEFELFGVPYAANTEIRGCADRSDVFSGTLRFTCYDDPAPASRDEVLVPIVMKKNEAKGHNFNNYSEDGCDTLGVATKTWKFTLPEKVSDSAVTLIISNHGANSGGEEYKPRFHLVYLDGELLTSWQQGNYCEPYRYLNTMGNGIYGSSTKDEVTWRRNSNWCPGASIPVRTLSIGELEPGEHSIMIRVPAAKFNDGQGDFPVSMYLQGVRTGKLPAGIGELGSDEDTVKVRRNGDVYRLDGAEVTETAIYSYDGALLYGRNTTEPEISLVAFPSGVYILTYTLADGTPLSLKAIK